MPDPSKALDALTQWQTETRQQIINDVGNAILKALHKIGFQQEADEPEVIRKPRPRKPRPPRAKLRRKLRAGTDMERVFTTIQKHPGNKGFQIQALLAQAGTVIHERTLRTCLNRLKLRGYIEQRGDDKAWFPMEGQKA
jgi:hypothetical protein